jgi:hypothetical protein
MATIIKDEELIRIPGSVKPDSKKRVVLPSFLVREDIIYHIYSNSVGQIVLDPQVTIPASEAWLFKNPVAIAAVRRGLADAAQGKVSRVKLSTL